MFAHYARWKYQQFNALELQRAQLQQLQQLIAAAQGSTFYTHHGLATVKTYADYVEHVPLYRAETLWERYLAPHTHNLNFQLTGGIVTHLARTSGSSTGHEKYMPINGAFLKHLREAAFLQGYFNYLRCPPARRWSTFRRPMLWLTDLSDYFEIGHYPTAMISRIINERMGPYPPVIPQREFFEHIPANKRFDALVKQACESPVSSLSGITPWLLLFCERALAHTGKKHLHDIWPHLQFILHAGVDFKPYQKRFEALLQRPVTFVENYTATEGFLGIQDLAQAGLRCLPQHGLFYEFVKVSERHLERPTRYALWQVEAQQDYSLFITNLAGFWSVEVGDILRFSQTHPYPLFQVKGRAQAKCDFFGEKLLVSEIEQALRELFSHHTSAALRHFAVGPHAHVRRLQILLELETQEPESFEALTQWIKAQEPALDLALQSLNTQYHRNRRGGVHLAPELHLLPPGSFQRALVQHDALALQRKSPTYFETAQHMQAFINNI